MKKLNDLSKEEKRILAAEACGHKWFTDALGHRILSPDYGNDLNAMHEAEKTVPYELQPILLRELKRVVMNYQHGVSDWDIYTATASQRLDAFLLAKGLAG